MDLADKSGAAQRAAEKAASEKDYNQKLAALNAQMEAEKKAQAEAMAKMKAEYDQKMLVLTAGGLAAAAVVNNPVVAPNQIVQPAQQQIVQPNVAPD